jgi:putative transposase
MPPHADPERDKNHRVPADILRHGGWLADRFTLSSRDVEELLLERGLPVSHEAVRPWCRQFGHDDANRLRRRRPQPGDPWHLDEVFLTLQGARHALWRAVAQAANGLAILVQSRRNQQAAKQCVRKLLKGLQYVPRGILTAKRKSYGAAKRERLPGGAQRQSRYLKNRCENSHQPTRHREHRRQGGKAAGHAPRFLSAYGPMAHHFRPRRPLRSAPEYRTELRQRCASWAEIPGTQRAA